MSCSGLSVFSCQLHFAVGIQLLHTGQERGLSNFLWCGLFYVLRELIASLNDMEEIRPICLEELPNEIICHIVRLADLERLQKGLLCRPSPNNTLNLMLCSSRLHAVAEPMLHDHVILRPLRSLPLFMYKLIARPAYAKRLQILHATAHGSRSVVSGLPPIDNDVVSDAVNQVTHSQEDASKWVNAIQKGVWDAFMALLLVLTPNMREIKLDQWGYTSGGQPGDDSFTFDVLKRAAYNQRSGSENSSPSLRRLRKLSLEAWYFETTYDLDMATPFLELPSLRSVNLVGMNEDSGFLFPSLKTSPTSFAVTDLSLESCFIPHVFMPCLFWNFTCIERFYFCHGICTNGGPDFVPPYMKLALGHLKGSLKKLTILDEYVRDKNKTIEDTRGSTNSARHTRGGSKLATYSIGTFSDFNELTHIYATAFVMIGDGIAETYQGFSRSQRLVDVIPPALQSLTLRKCGENIVSNIFELVSQKESRAPRLKYLDLDWKTIKFSNDRLSVAGPFIHPGFTKEQAHELISACQKAQIELKIHAKFPPPKRIVCKVGAAEPKHLQGLTLEVEYPWTKYEEYCKNHGCDPATGKPPGPGIYPETHVDLWPAAYFEE